MAMSSFPILGHYIKFSSYRILVYSGFGLFRFSNIMSWSFLCSVSSVLRWEVIGCFVDICGIDDRHCLNCLFIIHGITYHPSIPLSPILLLEITFNVIGSQTYQRKQDCTMSTFLHVQVEYNSQLSLSLYFHGESIVGIRRRSMTLYSRSTTHPVI